ncbi:heparan sulfate 2-O-sulfotransferase 1-like [Mya arenaria]|uniref:heparan sulfate 2-O-sulfotransferase 1-like n=1 Tax=Mya arenaria TaxID=6604 RepID=UPI0022E4942B|nr:heparan sulfate 2-O-sulfotransferase 1-like [Mya arenaria]XP_052790082.1 heparan sulfate 2-O-sulfotransferase 1-like [Mya arenaria]
MTLLQKHNSNFQMCRGLVSVIFQFKKNKLFLFILGLCTFILILLYEVAKRDKTLAILGDHLSRFQSKSVRRHLTESSDMDLGVFGGEDQLVIYNRVPKTGSTSFAGIAYELCYRNKYHVLHVNISRNAHTMSIPDQMRFIQNITEWYEKRPAIYHGHFYYINFQKLGYNDRLPVYINIIRKPLERLLSYYYFVRYGDNFRPHIKRRKMGNDMTFDDCVEQGHKDCDPVNLWLQIPFFCGHSYRCRQPGSRWALEQAKYNLINNYLLVGVTEELGDFIAMLEVMLPRFFKGAMDLYINGERSHLRKTNKKDNPSKSSIAKIEESAIWKMEHEFYEFALDHFRFQKRLTFAAVDTLDPETAADLQNQQSFLLSDGRLYVPKGLQFHYEKVRPDMPG